MKKFLQAAVLILLTSSAVMAAATSSHSRANNQYPNEWEHASSFNPDSFFINHSTITKK